MEQATIVKALELVNKILQVDGATIAGSTIIGEKTININTEELEGE